MDKVVIQDAHTSHVLMYCDSLGFLDGLHHIVALLLSGTHRENGQLVKLDAVQKSRPGTNENSLVRNSIHANPPILCVHFLHNLSHCVRWSPMMNRRNILYAWLVTAIAVTFFALKMSLNWSREARQCVLASLDSSGGNWK
jgi:hypothetical protein